MDSLLFLVAVAVRTPVLFHTRPDGSCFDFRMKEYMMIARCKRGTRGEKGRGAPTSLPPLGFLEAVGWTSLEARFSAIPTKNVH